MNICAWGNGSGSKYWRLVDPLKYLEKRGFKTLLSENGINKADATWADANVIQSCTDKNGIAYLYQLQQEEGKKLVVECDDFFDLNEDSPFNEEHDLFEAKFVITQTMKFADMITTTTPYLAKKLRKYNKNVVVLPNYIDYERWNQPYMPNDTKKIRIGWAGSITHLNDMKMIVKPLKKICKEFKNIQLVIIGDPRVAELFKGLNVESMNGVPFEVWPSKLHSLRLDIGLAPLRDTEFNRCKSNIKWIEYSIAKVPGVYSPTVYNNYDFDGNYGQIAETEEQWYRCIKNYIICENLRKDIASRARGAVKTGYTLKTNVGKWVKAYNKLTESKKGSIKT